MQNLIPGALQRLRAADIIRMAGLAAASLGQEYCRTGAIHNTERQEARLTGIVDVPRALHAVVAPTEQIEADAPVSETQRYFVTVEVQSPSLWMSTCQCGSNTPSLLCAHGAALLHQWLAHPLTFASTESPLPVAMPRSSAVAHVAAARENGAAPPISLPRAARTPSPTGQQPASQRTPVPAGDLTAILAQLNLSDLRGIAREYDIPTNGLSKQHLAEALVDVLKQPEAVRRVATTLEKAQRQLLAAVTLAGGSMTDEDLRGLFERFSLGQPNQLQRILLALQNKALLFRTSLNSSPSVQAGYNGSLLDIGWYVPVEVRTALRVAVPVTPIDVDAEQTTIQIAEPYRLLEDLLLVARALEGRRLANDDEWQPLVPPARSLEPMPLPRTSSHLSADGSVPVPPPADMPSAALLSALQANVTLSPDFLRFAVRLLRQAGILHRDDGGQPYLRLLAGSARLLLGSNSADVLRDLFELWLTQSSYGELFALQEKGVRLRCRATALNLPVLRAGELEMENNEARQAIIALLAQAPLNQWMSFQAFARFVYRLNPLFLQKRQRLFSSPHWWMEREEGRPLRPLQLSDWMHAELLYLTHLLAGPLHWWGACDIVRSADGRVQAFRLTPLAGWLFNTQPVEDAVVAGQDYRVPFESLEVVGMEDVLVTCSARAWPLIDLLETFTEPAGVQQSRLLYRLTPGALGDALSRGHRPAALLEVLRYLATGESLHASSLPAMVSQLEHWIASYGRVRIYTGVTLLETTDSVVMRELSATTSLDEQIVRPIHPTLLILKKAATERLSEDLKRRGQSPLLHDEEFYGPE